MRTLIFLIPILFLFAACDQPQPEQLAPAEGIEAPTDEAVSESGEPMAAAPTTIVAPTVYTSYHLVRGAGAIQQTGAIFLQTMAWQAVPAGQQPNNEKFISDLIAALDREGVLAGVDLTKTKSNWLIVLHPGATPRKGWVLDSRDMNLQTPAPK